MINDELNWFANFLKSDEYFKLKERPIAYFCAEFAISADLPLYAGGLGILAGDYVREAAERSVPLVAIGLFYPEGFGESIGRKVIDPEDAGLARVMNASNETLKIAIPIQDHLVYFGAWKWESGEVKLYLLDSHLPENNLSDQKITEKLYGNDREVRLKQEMALGIGGLRLMEALKIHPSHYHINEGHSAFLIYELIYHEMREHKMSFDEARETVRARVLYSNHTLLPAGNDTFSNDLVALILDEYAREIQIPVKTLVEMGLVQQSSTFSMTLLAMRAAGKINAVSKIHANKAKDIWSDHPMIPIANGINIKEWDKIKDEEQMWVKHQANKRELLDYVKSQTGEQWSEDTLVLGWARRIVGYKRPLSIVERLKKFLEIAQNVERPLKLIYSGIAHPSDIEGNDTLAELKYRIEKDLKGIAVYLPNYDMKLAKLMVAGCDVWANTPVVGFEACGTSGMKAALNGVLPLTTKDGWVDAVELYKIGWLLDDINLTDDILDKLENEILPIYYEKNQTSASTMWIEMMKNSRALILNDFSMTRALHQYLVDGMGIKV